MPSVEWMRAGREFESEIEVYISDAPSDEMNSFQLLDSSGSRTYAS